MAGRWLQVIPLGKAAIGAARGRSECIDALQHVQRFVERIVGDQNLLGGNQRFGHFLITVYCLFTIPVGQSAG